MAKTSKPAQVKAKTVPAVKMPDKSKIKGKVSAVSVQKKPVATPAKAKPAAVKAATVKSAPAKPVVTKAPAIKTAVAKMVPPVKPVVASKTTALKPPSVVKPVGAEKPALKLAVSEKITVPDEDDEPRGGIKHIPLPRPSLAAQFTSATLGAKLPPRLQLVIDQQELEQLLFTNCRALDRGEESLLRSVYHPDATLDMGPGIFQGTVMDYVHWVMTVMQQVKSSHTMISNMRIDVRSDEAFGESYFMAQNRLDKATGREDLFLCGRYLDRFERRPAGPAGVWKIVHRKVVLDWVRTEAVADIFYHLNPDALWGQRSKSDTSYQLEQFPGGQNSAGINKLPTFVGRRYEGKSIKL